MLDAPWSAARRWGMQQSKGAPACHTLGSSRRKIRTQASAELTLARRCHPGPGPPARALLQVRLAPVPARTCSEPPRPYCGSAGGGGRRRLVWRSLSVAIPAVAAAGQGAAILTNWQSRRCRQALHCCRQTAGRSGCLHARGRLRPAAPHPPRSRSHCCPLARAAHSRLAGASHGAPARCAPRGVPRRRQGQARTSRCPCGRGTSTQL
jgi:hypothetical protein